MIPTSARNPPSTSGVLSDDETVADGFCGGALDGGVGRFGGASGGAGSGHGHPGGQPGGGGGPYGGTSDQALQGQLNASGPWQTTGRVFGKAPVGGHESPVICDQPGGSGMPVQLDGTGAT